MKSYGGDIVAGTATHLVPDGRSGFTVVLADGQRISARRLLVTTGLLGRNASESSTPAWPPNADLNNSALAAPMFWLARLLGNLRWLLPPLTASTDVFTLAGVVRPTYAVGGDAFGYNFADTTASLAIFVAMEHALAPLDLHCGARRPPQRPSPAVDLRARLQNYD